ncbi:MAG TPA: dTDP-4-dehydrorhamnose reductase [candidate division Zixibacteria bacterium]|jgi:dTDP-4-dehydrorhamnose reductase|nr:dTDP-4-dehydrorhamnose reductase [candidate division Zixibacteria bacterium]
MRILVTGAGGMLGRDLVPVLSERHQVDGVDLDDFDLTAPGAVHQITSRRPEMVMHLAAMTNVDGCERDPERAMLVNGQGTRNAVEACRELGIPMLYISTDFVFDGTKSEPYREDDPVNPLGHYGRSKLAGEEAVRQLLREYYIVRTSWLFGPSGRNFVSSILNKARENGEVRVVDDQTGSPTYTADLAGALAELTESDKFGVYHLSNSGSCTWHGFASEAVRLAGIDARVVPIKSTEFQTPTRRPGYSVLGNYNWIGNFGRPLRDWREALADYVRLTEFTGGKQ